MLSRKEFKLGSLLVLVCLFQGSGLHAERFRIFRGGGVFAPRYSGPTQNYRYANPTYRYGQPSYRQQPYYGSTNTQYRSPSSSCPSCVPHAQQQPSYANVAPQYNGSHAQTNLVQAPANPVYQPQTQVVPVAPNNGQSIAQNLVAPSDPDHELAALVPVYNPQRIDPPATLKPALPPETAGVSSASPLYSEACYNSDRKTLSDQFKSDATNFVDGLPRKIGESELDLLLNNSSFGKKYWCFNPALVETAVEPREFVKELIKKSDKITEDSIPKMGTTDCRDGKGAYTQEFEADLKKFAESLTYVHLSQADKGTVIAQSPLWAKYKCFSLKDPKSTEFWAKVLGEIDRRIELEKKKAPSSARK